MLYITYVITTEHKKKIINAAVLAAKRVLAFRGGSRRTAESSKNGYGSGHNRRTVTTTGRHANG